MNPEQVFRQVFGLLRQVLYVAGVLIAAMAALKLFAVTSFPLPRFDLLQLAAVSAACVFAGR